MEMIRIVGIAELRAFYYFTSSKTLKFKLNSCSKLSRIDIRNYEIGTVELNPGTNNGNKCTI